MIATAPAPPLPVLQSLFQTAVMDDHEPIAPWIASTHALVAEHRVAIYQHAYRARLIECLENEFPVLVETVGEEAFSQFVGAYLREHPSTSYTLGRLSTRFVDFLTRTRPPLLSDSSEPDWFDFVIDVARLEEAINIAFDGPGFESSSDVPANRGGRDEDAHGRLRIAVNPSLRVLQCGFPVHAYYGKMREKEPDACQAKPTTIAVYRRDFVVRYRAITPLQAELLRQIALHGDLEQSLAGLVQSYTDSVTPEAIQTSMSLFASESLIAIRYVEETACGW